MNLLFRSHAIFVCFDLQHFVWIRKKDSKKRGKAIAKGRISWTCEALHEKPRNDLSGNEHLPQPTQKKKNNHFMETWNSFDALFHSHSLSKRTRNARFQFSCILKRFERGRCSSKRFHIDFTMSSSSTSQRAFFLYEVWVKIQLKINPAFVAFWGENVAWKRFLLINIRLIFSEPHGKFLLMSRRLQLFHIHTQQLLWLFKSVMEAIFFSCRRIHEKFKAISNKRNIKTREIRASRGITIRIL